MICESLYVNLSSGMKSHCRIFDIVKFEENSREEVLYQVDFDISNVTASRNLGEKRKKEKKELKMKK